MFGFKQSRQIQKQESMSIQNSVKKSQQNVPQVNFDSPIEILDIEVADFDNFDSSGGNVENEESTDKVEEQIKLNQGRMVNRKVITIRNGVPITLERQLSQPAKLRIRKICKNLKVIEQVDDDDWMKQWPELHPIREDLRECANQKGKESYIKKDFMRGNSKLNPRMREILVEWMIRVVQKIKVSQQALFLAVWITDKFCQKQMVGKDLYQLLGLTSLFMAAKYVDVQPPKLEKYEFKNLFSKQQILNMQNQILLKLQYRLGVMTRLDYLKEFMYREKGQFYQFFYITCLSILEETLIQYEFRLINPALVSLAVLVVVGKKQGKNFLYSIILDQFHLGQQQFKETIRKVQQLYSNRQADKFKVIESKYNLLLNELKKSDDSSRLNSKQNQKALVKDAPKSTKKKMETAQKTPKQYEKKATAYEFPQKQEKKIIIEEVPKQNIGENKENIFQVEKLQKKKVVYKSQKKKMIVIVQEALKYEYQFRRHKRKTSQKISANASSNTISMKPEIQPDQNPEVKPEIKPPAVMSNTVYIRPAMKPEIQTLNKPVSRHERRSNSVLLNPNTKPEINQNTISTRPGNKPVLQPVNQFVSRPRRRSNSFLLKPESKSNILSQIENVKVIKEVDEQDGKKEWLGKSKRNIFFEKAEQCNYVVEDHMDKSVEINEKIREGLIGELMNFIAKKSIKEKALFLAVFILDKYCEKRSVQKQEYRFLGYISLYVAVETIDQDEIFDLSSEYKMHQVLKMKKQIKNIVQVQAGVKTRLDYLDLFLGRISADERQSRKCHYILELTLMEYYFCLFNPVLVGWAVVIVGVGHKQIKNFEFKIAEQFGICKLQLDETVKQIEVLEKKRCSGKFQGINNKYGFKNGNYDRNISRKNGVAIKQDIWRRVVANALKN